MHKLRATGILKRLDKNINSEKPKNEPSTEINTDFPSVVPIFVILAVGLVLAILVLLLEIYVRKMKIGSVKFNVSDRPYLQWNVNTADTPSSTCFDTSWVPSSRSPYIKYHTTNKCTNCMPFILNHFLKHLFIAPTCFDSISLIIIREHIKFPAKITC